MMSPDVLPMLSSFDVEADQADSQPFWRVDDGLVALRYYDQTRGSISIEPAPEPRRKVAA